MKKVTSIFLSVILIVSLAACGQSEEKQQADTQVKVQSESSEDRETDTGAGDSAGQGQETNVEDGFIRITGGTFLMGSPEDEAWRSDDETQHPVTVSDFYMAPYEVTQAEYEAVIGNNPSNFSGSAFLWKISRGWRQFPSAMLTAKKKGWSRSMSLTGRM